MSDLSDTPQCEGACPLPERVEFAQWLLRFVDPDRSSDYRDAFWDLLRALLTQYQGDGKDGIEPSSLSTQELWRWALDERGKSVEGLTSDNHTGPISLNSFACLGCPHSALPSSTI